MRHARIEGRRKGQGRVKAHTTPKSGDFFIERQLKVAERVADWWVVVLSWLHAAASCLSFELSSAVQPLFGAVWRDVAQKLYDVR